MHKYLFAIIIILIVILGCNDYSEYKAVQQLSANCFYEYKDKTELLFKNNIHFSDREVTNCFFMDNNIICVSTRYKIYFYNIDNREIIKIINFEKGNKENRYQTIATKKSNSSICIISFGKVYEYNYKADKLDLIYSGFDDIFSFENKEFLFWCHTTNRGKAPPMYYKKNNSVVFIVSYQMDIKNENIIKEFDLNNFTLKDIVKGSRPYVNEEKNVLYYISEDEKEVREMNLNTLQSKVLFKYSLPIFYFIPNKNGDRFVFIHRTKGTNMSGNYSQESKIWDEKTNKVKKFSNKYWAIASDIIFPEDLDK